MPQELKISKCARISAVLLSVLFFGTGCQTWRSASAIPGLSMSTGESKVVAQAKNDPFPSPADVGMQSTK